MLTEVTQGGRRSGVASIPPFLVHAAIAGAILAAGPVFSETILPSGDSGAEMDKFLQQFQVSPGKNASAEAKAAAFIRNHICSQEETTDPNPGGKYSFYTSYYLTYTGGATDFAFEEEESQRTFRNDGGTVAELIQTITTISGKYSDLDPDKVLEADRANTVTLECSSGLCIDMNVKVSGYSHLGIGLPSNSNISGASAEMILCDDSKLVDRLRKAISFLIKKNGGVVSPF